MKQWYPVVASIVFSLLCIDSANAFTRAPQTADQKSHDELALQADEIAQKKFSLSDSIFTAKFTGETQSLNSYSTALTFDHTEAIKGEISSDTVYVLISLVPPTTDPGKPATPDHRKLKTGEKYILFARKNDWNPNYKSKYPAYYAYYIVSLAGN